MNAAAAAAFPVSSPVGLRRHGSETKIRNGGGGIGHGAVLRLILAVALILLGAASAALAQSTGAAPAAASSDGWWEQAARVVVMPWVTIGLLVVGCLLLFFDLLTPLTWGAAGTIGVLMVLLVFASHITAGTGGWIGVVLLLGGLTLLLLETHVFPGHGIAAVAGLLLLFMGMFWSLGGTHNAAFALGVSTILTIVSLIAFFAYLPKSPVWKKLGQEMRQRAALGYVTSDDKMHLLGRTGKALTVLRPAGAAEIDGYRIDVVTEGEFLEMGTPLRVIKVEGGRVVVDDIALAPENCEPEETALAGSRVA